MDPINYSEQVQQPFQAAAQGYQLGAGIVANQEQQQQTSLQLQQQQLGMQRAQAMQQASMAVAQNPTPQAIAQLAIAFPEMSKQFKDANDMLTPVQQQGRIDHASAVYAALQSGRPDVAANLLNARADALENSGDTQGAGIQRSMAQWATLHPDSLKMTAGMMLASAMGPDKFATTFSTIGPSALDKSTADASKATTEAGVAAATAPEAVNAAILNNQNIQSQINQRAGQLALDKDKLTSDTQTKLYELGLQYGTPDPETRKQINDAAVDAASQEQSAARLNDLAARVDQASYSTGGAGHIADIWKAATNGVPGFNGQDAITSLKQEIARQVNSTAIQQIRSQMGGGSRFTDTDMKVALGNVPDANSTPAVVSSYFRGMSKLQTLASAQQQAQAEWLSQVKHLGVAPRDIKVMGTTVPAGTTFADFSRSFIQQKAAAMSAQQAAAHPIYDSILRPGDASASPPTASTAAPTAPEVGID